MKILIADDAQSAVEELKEMLAELLPGAVMTGTNDPEKILPLFEEQRSDIVFMDVKMNGRNCIHLAEKITEKAPMTNIIYITRYTRYAFQAFRTYPSAFLEKPVTADMLRDALAHLRHPISNLTDEMIENEYAGQAVIGGKIQKWREEYGMTRQELADALKVDIRTVYRWEHAERSPDIPTYMKILQILGKNADTM